MLPLAHGQKVEWQRSWISATDMEPRTIFCPFTVTLLYKMLEGVLDFV
jgi:hypothetical protein